MQSIDSDVVALVTKALLQDQRTWTAIIEVNSRGGIVRLSGSVSSEEGRQAAEEIARQQGGVKTVVNEIRVQPGEGGPIRSLVDAATASLASVFQIDFP
jgi:osmotically-inducible protein OsmY